MKRYSVIRNYKKFKREYPYFIVFITCKDYYYTSDSDAKIMMFIFESHREEVSFRIEKDKFTYVLKILLSHGLNVVLAGWKNSREYYSEKPNDYLKIKKKSKEQYHERQISTTQEC